MESNSSPAVSSLERPARRRRDLALLLPGLLLLAWCGFTWGGYFWLAGRAQAAAGQAARAVAAAPQAADLRETAAAAARQALGAPLTDIAVDREGATVRVRLTFDLSTNPIFTIRGPTPLPSPVIVRAAEAPTAVVAAAADRSAAPPRGPDAGSRSAQKTAERSE